MSACEFHFLIESVNGLDSAHIAKASPLLLALAIASLHADIFF